MEKTYEYVVEVTFDKPTVEENRYENVFGSRWGKLYILNTKQLIVLFFFIKISKSVTSIIHGTVQIISM